MHSGQKGKAVSVVIFKQQKAVGGLVIEFPLFISQHETAVGQLRVAANQSGHDKLKSLVFSFPLSISLRFLLVNNQARGVFEWSEMRRRKHLEGSSSNNNKGP
jgi:hypothetical protein